MRETDTSDRSETIRLFIALILPDRIADRLETLQERLRLLDTDRAIRWTATDGIHLTLKFLGDTHLDHRAEIGRELSRAVTSFAPFALHVEGIGAFPTLAAPQTIWAGVAGDLDHLRALRDAVETAIAPLGFPTESRPFSPHLTLGRTRPEKRRAAAAFGHKMSQLEIGPMGASDADWSVTGVSLMHSDLRPSGAVYSELTLCEFVTRA